MTKEQINDRLIELESLKIHYNQQFVTLDDEAEEEIEEVGQTLDEINSEIQKLECCYDDLLEVNTKEIAIDMFRELVEYDYQT